MLLWRKRPSIWWRPACLRCELTFWFGVESDRCCAIRLQKLLRIYKGYLNARAAGTRGVSVVGTLRLTLLIKWRETGSSESRRSKVATFCVILSVVVPVTSGSLVDNPLQCLAAWGTKLTNQANASKACSEFSLRTIGTSLSTRPHRVDASCHLADQQRSIWYWLSLRLQNARVIKNLCVRFYYRGSVNHHRQGSLAKEHLRGCEGFQAILDDVTAQFRPHVSCSRGVLCVAPLQMARRLRLQWKTLGPLTLPRIETLSFGHAAAPCRPNISSATSAQAPTAAVSLAVVISRRIVTSSLAATTLQSSGTYIWILGTPSCTCVHPGSKYCTLQGCRVYPTYGQHEGDSACLALARCCLRLCRSWSCPRQLMLSLNDAPLEISSMTKPTGIRDLPTLADL